MELPEQMKKPIGIVAALVGFAIGLASLLAAIKILRSKRL